ncbi:hypothetical protein QUB05_26485 [Microcoleus sp. F10-C6]|uniref:hypothetical protein n=1 Tax=unclassified Microcoleus TaxID=2642155 RepID=UPI002FD4321D
MLIIQQYCLCLDSLPARRLRFGKLAVKLNPASSDTGVAARSRACGQKAKFLSRSSLGTNSSTGASQFCSQARNWSFEAGGRRKEEE